MGDGVASVWGLSGKNHIPAPTSLLPPWFLCSTTTTTTCPYHTPHYHHLCTHVYFPTTTTTHARLSLPCIHHCLPPAMLPCHHHHRCLPPPLPTMPAVFVSCSFSHLHHCHVFSTTTLCVYHTTTTKATPYTFHSFHGWFLFSLLPCALAGTGTFDSLGTCWDRTLLNILSPLEGVWFAVCIPHKHLLLLPNAHHLLPITVLPFLCHTFL